MIGVRNGDSAPVRTGLSPRGVATAALLLALSALPTPARSQVPVPLDAEAELAALKLFEGSSEGAAPTAAGLDLATFWLLRGQWSEAADLLQETLERSRDVGDEESAATAAQLLAMIDRLCLRPAAGRARWSRARLFEPRRGEIRKATGVAARGDAQLLVSDDGTDSVLLLDAAGEIDEAWSVTRPGRPFWGPDGEISVESREGLTLLRGGDEASTPPAAEGGQSEGGNILDRARGAWRRLRSVVGIGGRSADREDPDAIIDQSLDAAGHWWVLAGDGSVVRLGDGEAMEERLALPPMRRPAALAVDPLGNFYLLDEAERRVEIYDRQGRLVVVVGPQLPGGLDLARPGDLAVDRSGRLFIADSRRGVVVLE